jgi:hypothetical protein
MAVSKALGWLCEEPDHSFTLKNVDSRFIASDLAGLWVKPKVAHLNNC